MKRRITRRHAIGAGALGVAGVALARTWSAKPVRACGVPDLAPKIPFSQFRGAQHEEWARSFYSWIRGPGTAKAAPVKNLVWNFYDIEKGRGRWIYPMLSGKAILWMLQRGKIADAIAVGHSLLRWQQTEEAGMAQRSFGAFPSLISDETGQWKAGDRYYSGDNLVILAALCKLYQKTGQKEWLNAAIGIGSWLVNIMCSGHKSGLWIDDHGAPMYFVTLGGDFANQINGTVEMFWIGSLQLLGELTGEKAYCDQAEKGFAFYRNGQAANGAYLDRYEPGYPPKPYDPGNWKPYQENQVISDNVLRAALGACRMGDITGARKFYQWLKVDGGGVPAYLNLKTGGHGFASDDEVYFDVTSSALHRTLCQWLGDEKQARVDIKFLEKARHPSGSWFWGIKKRDFGGVTPELGPIVGFWATADLSVVL